MLTDTLCIGKDINRATSCFLKQFNSLMYRFNYADMKVLAHLFRTYTSSFYAIENWALAKSNKHMHRISVAYHKAVKRICSMNVWESNHGACKTADVNIFKHLYAKRRITFMFSLRDTKSPCILPLKYYYQFRSIAANATKSYFLNEYQLVDLFSNPLCAIHARIGFVERNERSTGVL